MSWRGFDVLGLAMRIVRLTSGLDQLRNGVNDKTGFADVRGGEGNPAEAMDGRRSYYSRHTCRLDGYT